MQDENKQIKTPCYTTFYWFKAYSHLLTQWLHRNRNLAFLPQETYLINNFHFKRWWPQFVWVCYIKIKMTTMSNIVSVIFSQQILNNKLLLMIKKMDNYSKPTCDMARFHFAYSWFKSLHFAYLNFNPLPISVKIRGKNVFYLHFYVFLL